MLPDGGRYLGFVFEQFLVFFKLMLGLVNGAPHGLRGGAAVAGALVDPYHAPKQVVVGGLQVGNERAVNTPAWLS